MIIKIVEFEKDNYHNLYDFMKPIWYETYKDIIPDKQIEFLLNKYFTLERINYYENLGYKYFKIVSEETIGVLVIREQEEIFLDKIYFKPNYQNKGYLKSVISKLEEYKKPIVLNVNQKNIRAIKAYQKNGFEIIKEEYILLDDGMVNIDYIMKKASTSN